MGFFFHVPTEICFGAGIVKQSAAKLIRGKHAFIVTGHSSGRKSGALGDVIAALDANGVGYDLFEGIGNNPDVDQCWEVALMAKKCGADFVIGIGGGSPIDAAKAVAAFAASDLSIDGLFANEYGKNVLPIVAVPTTSGTGSEVTPWAVMTWHKIKSKRAFGGTATFPTVAMLDPIYTASLPAGITVSTALDAFAHCFESYISLSSEPISDAINLYVLKRFAACMDRIEAGDFDSMREELMLISMMAGTTISNTGTVLPHAMGYPLTYFYGVPHGQANIVVFPAFIDALMKHRHERLNEILDAMNLGAEELKAFIRRNCSVDITPKAEELAAWAHETSLLKKIVNTGIPVDEPDLLELYRQTFSK